MCTNDQCTNLLVQQRKQNTISIIIPFKQPSSVLSKDPLLYFVSFCESPIVNLCVDVDMENNRWFSFKCTAQMVILYLSVAAESTSCPSCLALCQLGEGRIMLCRKMAKSLDDIVYIIGQRS